MGKVFADFAIKGSVYPVQSSARWEHARGEKGCRRTPYSVHVQRPIGPSELLGGGACGASPSPGPAALSCAVSHVWDAASGCWRPVGGRTAARRAEGGAVGGHRAPGPRGGCLAGDLLQRLFGAIQRRARGTPGSRAASPASRANAGRRSVALRLRERVVVGTCDRPGRPALRQIFSAPSGRSSAERARCQPRGSSRPRPPNWMPRLGSERKDLG